MKSLTIALALALAAPLPAPPKPVNYSGDWTLDKARSTGLPSYYERVRSHELLVTQRVTQQSMMLDVAVRVDAGRATPDTMHLVYTLDGKETRTETPIRGPNGLTQVPTTLRAVVNPDRQVDITIARDITLGGDHFHAVTTEGWRLSPDGKTLAIHRVDDTPRGKVDANMIFVRSSR